MIKKGINMKKYPKIGLVLGSGGAKGFAHIGVLEALEKAGIKPDMVIGCSMGAIVGSCYAMGVSPKKMKEQVLSLSRSDIIDVKLPNRFGFVKGDRAEKVIRKFLGAQDAEPTFADCKIPFACACTDILKGEPVDLAEGELIPAVRASFSIPGVFVPIKIKDRYLWDGGLLRRVPNDLARRMGADIVVGVDCIGPTREVKEENLDSLLSTVVRIFFMMDYGTSRSEIQRADIPIDIGYADVDPIKMKNIEQSIVYAEKVVKKHIPEIKEKIKRWIEENN